MTLQEALWVSLWPILYILLGLAFGEFIKKTFEEWRANEPDDTVAGIIFWLTIVAWFPILIGGLFVVTYRGIRHLIKKED